MRWVFTWGVQRCCVSLYFPLPQGLERLTAVVVGIVIFSVIYILPTCYTKVPGPGCFDTCLQRMVHRLKKTDLRHNRLYIIIYKSNLALIISFVIPFGALLILNAKIILALRRVAKQRETATSTATGKSKAKSLQNQVVNFSFIFIHRLAVRNPSCH